MQRLLSVLIEVQADDISDLYFKLNRIIDELHAMEDDYDIPTIRIEEVGASR
jgi:hypothetical protein